MAEIKSVAVANRRRHPRAPVRISVGLQFGGQVIMAQSRDLSAGGIFIETSVVVASGTSMELFIMPPGASQSLRLSGTVVRPTSEGFGVAFSTLTGEARQGLERFLAAAASPLEAALGNASSPSQGDDDWSAINEAVGTAIAGSPSGAEPIPEEFDPKAIEAAIAKEKLAHGERTDLARQLHESAKHALEGGKWTNMAIDLLERAIELSPGIAAFHHDLGTAYFQTGQVDRAVKEFDRALQLEPEREPT